MNITIDKNTGYQTVTGFGVSGAWWAQRIGLWTETDEESGLPKRERIAELLFDREKGIGINQYRYNIGAGSKDSGKGKYDSENMRASNFETAPGIYDWSKDEGAVWFMRVAARYGVDEITMFVNSPIERLTQNKKAYLDVPFMTNLKRQNYKAFAKYTLDVADKFIKEGLPIKYISPVNEPVWFWLEKQEGCHYRPHQVYSIMKTFARMLDEYPSLRAVKLSGAENGDLRWFNKAYTHIMQSGAIKEKCDSVDFHSYFLPVPGFIPPFIAKPLNDRLAYVKRYRKWLYRHYPDAQLKVSEWCHMKRGRDYSINSALEQARVMAEDLKYLNVVSWQLWVALAGGFYCDGIIYHNPDRTFELTKRYYAFGNFSKYVRPGAVRIKTESDEDNVYTLAFRQKDNLTVIIINFTYKKVECNLNCDGSAEMFITSDKHSLEGFTVDDLHNFNIPARSVNTVVIKNGNKY